MATCIALAQAAQEALALCSERSAEQVYLQSGKHGARLGSRHAFGHLGQRCKLASACISVAASRNAGPLVAGTWCSIRATAVAERVRGAEVEGPKQDLTTVMKFGGSSVATAERMKEVASLILSFPEERPVIVLSAMGKTTNKLLEAGQIALAKGVQGFSEEFKEIERLHKTAVEALIGENSIEVDKLLKELQMHLTGIALLGELSPRTKDKLVSFGERLSTRIFAGFLNKLNKQGVTRARARQYDAFEIGFLTSSEFTNADILDAAYPEVAAKLQAGWEADGAIPIVTGFLGYTPAPDTPERKAITTLGRGGSDLTATVIGKALGLREVQVWKDVDGVLSCDPTIHKSAKPVPFLTFEEASELAYFGAQVLHPQSMKPAREAQIPVRVKNSYKPQAPGTLITESRDMTDVRVTSIVLKRHVTVLDIVSTRMLGQYGFLAKVFNVFEARGISVDVVATSDVSISLTLDPTKVWSCDDTGVRVQLRGVKDDLKKIATVEIERERAIISLIGNVKRSSEILEKAFCVLRTLDVNVQMISQGASKVNISLIVDDADAKRCIVALHKVFFEQSLADQERKTLVECAAE